MQHGGRAAWGRCGGARSARQSDGWLCPRCPFLVISHVFSFCDGLISARESELSCSQFHHPPRPPITGTSLKPPFVADDLLFDRLRDAPPLASTRHSQTHHVLLQPGAPQSRPHRPSAHRFLLVFGRHAGFSHYIIVRPRWSLFLFIISSVGASFQWAPHPQLAP